MATSNRTAQINHILKGIKRHFKPVRSAAERTVLEHVLFACCLENSPPEDAETAFAALKDQYFDWNEVRVSSIRELAESMKMLVDPEGSAIRLKRSLQSVFESLYAFDLEPLAKENLGKATERLTRYPGTTPFVVAYVTQAALGGHAIPVNHGLLLAFNVFGVISAEELQQGVIPGLERAVPKSKGPEVASVLHQLGVLVGRNPYSPAARKILVEIEPKCKERLPKRPAKVDETPPSEAEQAGPKRSPKKKPASRARAEQSPPQAKKKTPKAVKSTTTDGKKGASEAASKKKDDARSRKTAVKKKTASKRLAKSKPR